MSAQGEAVKKNFNKLFEAIALDLESPITSVTAQICYKDGGYFFEAYRSYADYQAGIKAKDFEIADYFKFIKAAMFTTVIDMTIGQAGGRYAKEVAELLKKEVTKNDISIILKNKENDFPIAAIMAFGEKQRKIDIEKEFLSN